MSAGDALAGANEATAEALLRLAATAPGPDRVRLERQVIRLHATLARDIARCYVPLGVHQGRGMQAAMAALVRAVRTYEPSGRDDFESYATSLIQLDLSGLLGNR
jgi:DNA-directed RNA polymerase specialized sigma subunit